MGPLENYYAYKNHGCCLDGRVTPSPQEGSGRAYAVAQPNRADWPARPGQSRQGRRRNPTTIPASGLATALLNGRLPVVRSGDFATVRPSPSRWTVASGAAQAALLMAFSCLRRSFICRYFTVGCGRSRPVAAHVNSKGGAALIAPTAVICVATNRAMPRLGHAARFRRALDRSRPCSRSFSACLANRR